jgi:ubiquinone biosynthesis protein Coq4
MNTVKKAVVGAVWLAGFAKLIKHPRLDDDRYRSKGPLFLEVLQNAEMRVGLMRDFKEEYREVFARRPRRGRIDLDALGRLPVGTFGRAFAEEMKNQGRTLGENHGVEQADDGSDIGYVFAYIKETHDFWHTVTGFGVDVAGEMGVLAFGSAQVSVMPWPGIIAAFLLNMLMFNMDDRYRRMDAVARGWQLGRNAKPFFGFDWEKHFSTPLVELREKLGLPADPGSTTRTSLRANQAMVA